MNSVPVFLYLLKDLQIQLQSQRSFLSTDSCGFSLLLTVWVRTFHLSVEWEGDAQATASSGQLLQAPGKCGELAVTNANAQVKVAKKEALTFAEHVLSQT